jgi:N-acetylneuraminic acid mutarotase
MLASCLSLTACSTNSGNTPPAATTPPLVTFTVGGTVSGLSGTGLVLQDNGGDNLALSANGAFTFQTAVSNSGAYAVTVLTQPSDPAQVCVVTNGRGTATANITNVQVTCTSHYTIGGAVSGLSGTGLTLQNNGGDNLAVSATGTFTFATPVSPGSTYNVTVLTQPTGQTCTVANATGTASANVTNVQVTCTTIILTYTIGGTVSGLSGTGLVLQNNGGDNLSVSTNGSFTFATPINAGSTYNVTILTQPSNPTQTCAVTGGSGTANANVTSVQVTCTAGPIHNQWAWINGADTADQLGIYGTRGTPSPNNVPGARYTGAAWTDTTGNFWLFGGFGLDSAGTTAVLNDLWKYSAGEWTWIDGSDIAEQPGVYGTQGVASPANVPGARRGAVHWTDAAGNFWLFGGLDPNAGQSGGEFNDLWKYSGGEWTWVSGSNTVGQSGTYGTLGQAAPGNIPGARVSAAGWIDASGNLWLFGGDGFDSASNFGFLNDLWEYSISSGQWTWMNGANTTYQAGSYGTQGTTSPTNVPGARRLAVTWIDSTGTFWLFGGNGLDSAGAEGELNDLWKYQASEWTWVNGSHTENQLPTYGTQGVASPTNVPGARDTALGLTDAAGNFWLFAGEGLDSTDTSGQLNDLWKYTAGEWTWISGSNIANQIAIYGTKGKFAPANIPGGRSGAIAWTDSAGNLWIFGGGTNSGELNDLWKYTP